jgi:hypothetical protein
MTAFGLVFVVLAIVVGLSHWLAPVGVLYEGNGLFEMRAYRRDLRPTGEVGRFFAFVLFFGIGILRPIL